MKSKNYNCLICLEPITNPLCVKCYLKEIDLWLREEIDKKLIHKIILLSILEKIPENKFQKDICILCQKEEVTICSYCFFLKSLEVIRKSNLPRKKIESFKEIFNYSLGHTSF